MNRIDFKEEKNEIINKRAGRITWKCKNICYYLKKLVNRYVKDENIAKLEIRVIIQGKIQVLPIEY